MSFLSVLQEIENRSQMCMNQVISTQWRACSALPTAVQLYLNSRQRYFTILTPPCVWGAYLLPQNFAQRDAALVPCRKWHLLTAAHFQPVPPLSLDQHNHLGWLCSAMDEWKNQGWIWTYIFFSSGSPTHRKLLLKNKSFALANISSETNFVLIPEDRIWPRYIHMFCQLYKGGERGHSK